MTELNRRHNFATIPTTNNNGEPYIVPVDIYKEGYSTYDISNWFKGRTGDNGTPFAVRWYAHGRLLNILGYRPFIEGKVGDYTIDDSDPDNPQIDMANDADDVHVVGDVSDCQEGGIAIYRLINDAMPKSGIFYGKIGFMGTADDGTAVMTSIDIVFKILANHMNMLGARKFYVSELEKAILEFDQKIKDSSKHYDDLVDQLNQKNNKVIDDARNAYENETKDAHASLDALKSQIQANRDEQQTLSNHLAGTEQQIEIHDVVTKPEFLQLSNQLSQQIAQMRQNGLEFFNNADALKQAYPQGANKLCVTLDDSHQWIYDYTSGTWKDTGSFNYGTIDPNLMQGFYSKNPDNLIANSDFNSTNLWNFGENSGSNPNYTVSDENAIDGSNVLVLTNVKQGNQNVGIWAQSNHIQVGDQKTVSLAAETNYYQQDNGDAFIQINFLNNQGKRTIWSQYITPTQKPDFSKNLWENIQIPAGTVEMFLAFGIDGSGRLKILRPQINYGIAVNAYSGSEIANNMTTTTRDLLADYGMQNWIIHNSGDSQIAKSDQYYLNNPLFNLHSDKNTTGNWAFIASPKMRVISGSTVMLDIPYTAKFNTGSAFFYAEIDEYQNQEDADSQNMLIHQLANKNDITKLTTASFDLSNRTNYISVKFVLNGAGDVYLGKPNLYYNESINHQVNVLRDKYSDDLLSDNSIFDWQVTAWGGSKNYIAQTDPQTTYKNKPMLHLKNNQKGSGVFVSSDVFQINGQKEAVITVPMRVVNETYAFVQVEQFDQQNVSHKYTYYVEPTSDIIERSIYVKIAPSTKQLQLDFVTNEQGEMFVGIPQMKFLDQDVLPTEPQFWQKCENGLSLMPKKQVIDGQEVLVVNQDNNQSKNYWLWAISAPIDVSNVKSLSFTFNGSIDYVTNRNNSASIEIDQFTNWADAFNGNKDQKRAIVCVVDPTDGFTDFNFENIQLLSDTKFITFRAVAQNTACIKLKSLDVQFKASLDDLLKPSDLPQMDLICSGSITDKWQNAQFKYIDNQKSLNGYLQYAIQGSSSRNYPKKNLKVKLFKDAGCTKKLKVQMKSTWLPESKFNLKANWIDSTQARNLVNAGIFAKATEITPITNDGKNLAKSPNMGQMDGFPFELYLNGQYYGLMTWNLKKTDKSFGMDSSKPEDEVIDCAQAMPKTLGDPDKTIDGTNYEINIQDTASDALKANFKSFITFLTTSSDADFKSKLGTYIDVKSVINAYLFGILSMMQDYETKSMMICTWDNGKTYYPLYDFDSTWNLWWRGDSLNQEPARWSFDITKPANDFTVEQNTLYNRIWKLFKPEIKAQWQFLRANVWRNDQIIKAFKKFINQIPADAYKRDQTKWPDIPSIKITDFEQIQQSIIERGNAMDDFMFHLTDTQSTTPATNNTGTTGQNK